MCGILAVFCNSIPSDLKKIIDGGKYLKARGPEKCVSFIKRNGIYIFHRLSINDTSAHGDQPIVRHNIILMCNGEIYNHDELKKEFDIQCSSNSDCEVIIHLYKKLGFVEAVKKLNGVFAIILVEGDNVYIARDRIGVRPLYYGLTQEKYLAVSSLPNSLEGWCESIVPFPPGMTGMHNKNLQDNTIKWLYQDLVTIPESRNENPIESLYQSLYSAVKKRLLTDRPIGCLLSGGLDSSCITALLCELLGPKNVRTYSIGMNGSTDLYYAKLVANYFGTQHTEVLFTPEEGFAAIPEIIRDLGSYDITTIRASVGMWLISKYISEHSNDKVIFSGEGSDEIMCGYLYFHNAPSPKEAEDESLRLVQQLHLYDVLRADRTISAHGLELREPFLDRRVVDLAMSFKTIDKAPANGYEKFILRKAFVGKLPDEVVWRRKEGFSDGVSSIKKPWYQYIQERVDKIIPDDLLSSDYPSKEAMYYHMIFKKFFPTFNIDVPYWMPKWSNCSDPSGRMIKAFDEPDKELD